MDKLPPLPVLPVEVSELPFIHKSYAHELHKRGDLAGGINSELASHKKYEHLGDAALRLFITDWVLKNPNIESGIASRVGAILMSNAFFGRLAEGYGWKDKVKVGKTSLKDGDEIDPKILADCFQAYFGLVWLSIAGDTDLSDIRNYFDVLFGEEVFPDLRSTIDEWQASRNKKRASEIKRHPRKRRETTSELDKAMSAMVLTTPSR